LSPFCSHNWLYHSLNVSECSAEHLLKALQRIPLRIERSALAWSPFISSITNLLKAVLLPKHLATPPMLVDVEFKRRWFANKKSLLDSVVSWLDSSDDRDEWWNLKAQLVQLCLVELVRKIRG
jgi:hypothetical protein